MPSAETHRDFATAILDPARPLPPGIVGPDGAPSARRFAVYRNNVIVGLTEILRAAFPAVRRLVGEEFFDAMAGVYVRAEPPGSPVLLEYGVGFPAFIGKFGPAASVPYLHDVAQIEWAWVEAYHAPDLTPLTAEAFQGVPPEKLPEIRLDLHPSLRIARSKFRAFTIWAMNVGDSPAGEVTLEGEGEDTLIVRPEATVEVRSLPLGAADFIAVLGAGDTVLDATVTATARHSDFDLAANLAGLIEAGALIAYRFGNNDIRIRGFHDRHHR